MDCETPSAERVDSTAAGLGAVHNPAAWPPVGGADHLEDLQLDHTRFMCSELWSCQSSAVYALLSFGWRRFRIMEYLLSITEYVFVTGTEPQPCLLAPRLEHGGVFWPI